MRWLLWIVIVAGLIWGGIWFVASTAVSRGAVAAFDMMNAQGLVATRSDIAVRGFPNRLDLTVTAPRLLDPLTGVGYDAPFVQMFALTWRPWHLIAAFPSGQRLTTIAGQSLLAADRLQASLVLEPAAALPLDRLAIAGDGLALTLSAPGTSDATLAIASLRFATRRDPSRRDTHEIGLDITGMSPDPALLAALPSGALLPAAAERLRITAFAGLSAPIDRFAGETRPTLIRLDLTEASFAWGDIGFRATGTVTPDDQGIAEGRIDIRLTGWPTVLAAATAAGLIRPEIAPTWAELARRLSETADDPDSLDLPLTLSGGRMSLGPFPLGPAPRLIAVPQD